MTTARRLWTPKHSDIFRLRKCDRKCVIDALVVLQFSVFTRGEGRGGGFGGGGLIFYIRIIFWGGSVPVGLENPYPISDRNIRFSIPYFRPALKFPAILNRIYSVRDFITAPTMCFLCYAMSAATRPVRPVSPLSLCRGILFTYNALVSPVP